MVYVIYKIILDYVKADYSTNLRISEEFSVRGYYSKIVEWVQSGDWNWLHHGSNSSYTTC